MTLIVAFSHEKNTEVDRIRSILGCDLAAFAALMRYW